MKKHMLVGLLILAFGEVASAKETGVTTGLDRNQVFELQFRLDQLGFDAGQPDGRAGKQTRDAVTAYATKLRTEAEMTPGLLKRLREATVGLEGLEHQNGRVDLLVFTDEGTAQILKVENWGLIHKSNSSVYIRDYDRDGSPLEAEHFDVSRMERTTSIPFEPWVSFSYKMYFPTPPKGERLEVEETKVQPERNEDGSVTLHTYVFKNVFLEAPPPGAWYWYTGPEKDMDSRREGSWTMTLGQRGQILMSRVFDVRHQ